MGRERRRKPPAGSAAVPVSAGERVPAGRRVPAALIAILGGAALFRAAYFLEYRWRSVFYDTPFLDAAIYDAWARRLAAGEGSPPEPFYFAPGYPYALGLLYRLFSPSLAVVYVVQFALGVASIALIHHLARLAFGSRAALWAAGLAALYASFPFLEAKVMSASPALALLLGSLALLAWAGRRGGAWRWAASGLLLGLTSLVRPETLLTAPFVLVWIHRWGVPPPAEGIASPWRRAPSRAAAAAAGLLAAGWVAAILPAVAHNVRNGGGSTLISSQGGITFYQSNNPRARGLYVFLSREGFSGAPERQAQEEKAIAEKALGRPLSRSEVSAYWFGKGVEFIRERPGRFLWLLGMKLLRFVGSYEYSTEYILYVERETVRLLWAPFVPFALIVALAVPALARSLAGGRGGAQETAGAEEPPARLNAAGGLLLLTLAANVATVLAFYVSSRYRLPSAPPLMAFGGATLARATASWRSGRGSSALATAAVIGGVFLLGHSEKDASATIQEANVHYNVGNLWAGKKRHDRALDEYRRAIEMDDTRYEFRFNMANSLRDLGRHAEAAAAYGIAAEMASAKPHLRGDTFRARVRQGQMLEKAGDWAGSRAAFLQAEAIRPDDFEVHLGLGKAAARLGDRAEAVARLDRALQIRPDSEAARAERARL